MVEKIEQNYAYISENIIRALEFAARAHRDQYRKGLDQTPYFSHPAGVGLILAQTGCREEVIIAGILHDVIEDTKFTYSDIVNNFGVDIADLVKWVSIPEEAKGLEGKEAYLKNLENAPAEARLISAADMLYNRADVILAFNNTEEKFNSSQFKTYLIPELNEKRIAIIEAGLGADHQLVKDLKEQHEIFKDHINLDVR